MLVDLISLDDPLQPSCRQWQQRRVIVTKEKISFAFIGEEKQIDHIPLSEVEFIMEMKDIAGQEHGEDEVGDRHRMQIATLPKGYNSGRTYYIATPTKDLLDRLLKKLKQNTKAAIQRAEAKSLFRKLQLMFRKRYESNFVQASMALLIGAVRVIP